MSSSEEAGKDLGAQTVAAEALRMLRNVGNLYRETDHLGPPAHLFPTAAHRRASLQIFMLEIRQSVYKYSPIAKQA